MIRWLPESRPKNHNCLAESHYARPRLTRFEIRVYGCLSPQTRGRRLAVGAHVRSADTFARAKASRMTPDRQLWRSPRSKTAWRKEQDRRRRDFDSSLRPAGWGRINIAPSGLWTMVRRVVAGQHEKSLKKQGVRPNQTGLARRLAIGAAARRAAGESAAISRSAASRGRSRS